MCAAAATLVWAAAPAAPAAAAGPPTLVSVATIGPNAIVALGDAVSSMIAGEPGASQGCENSWYSGCMSRGFVLASRDGGRTWRAVLSERAGLQGLQGWPDGDALTWGPGDLLLGTADGTRWRRLPLPPGGALVWADFASPADGWAETMSGCVALGGDADLEAQPNQNGQTCYEGVFATSDSGAQWREIAYSVGYPIADRGAEPVSELSGPAVYDGDGRGYLTVDAAWVVTDNDGRTWTEEPVPPGDLAWSVFDRVSGTGGRQWALNDLAGRSGVPVRTEVTLSADGGLTWTVVDRPNALLDALAAGPSNVLWAVGDGSGKPGVPGDTDPWQCPPPLPQCGRTVWLSRDGGLSWRPLAAAPAGVEVITALAPETPSAVLAVVMDRGGRYAILRLGLSRHGASWTSVYAADGAPGG